MVCARKLLNSGFAPDLNEFMKYVEHSKPISLITLISFIFYSISKRKFGIISLPSINAFRI